jgi:3-dehydroquinate dehydratase-2
MSPATHNRVAVLHGVNFDILDRRDASVYGGLSLGELETKIGSWARELGLEAIFFQTNAEGEFVEYLHRLPDMADAAVINAGAWTHYSRAIADALDVASMPAVEVHLSDVDSREDWRRVSVFDGLVLEKISGKGPDGYRDALEALARELGVSEG